MSTAAARDSRFTWGGVLLLAVACAAERTPVRPSTPPPPPAEIIVSPTPQDFESINLNANEPTACTPDMDDNALGIRIAAPARVSLQRRVTEVGINEDHPALPICGAHHFSAKTINQFYAHSQQIALVLVDARDGRAYASSLRDWLLETVPPGRYPSPQEGQSSIGYFNANAFLFVRSLPWRPATYHVHAVLGPYRSNRVTVAVEGEPAPSAWGEDVPELPLGPGAATFELAGAPSVVAGFRGVAVSATTGPGESVTLHGTFQVDAREAEQLQVGGLHRALSLVAAQGLATQAGPLLRSELTFPEDERRAGSVRTGAFHVRISRVPAPGEEPLYLTVTLGAHLSNTVEVRRDGAQLAVQVHP